MGCQARTPKAHVVIFKGQIQVDFVFAARVGCSAFVVQTPGNERYC